MKKIYSIVLVLLFIVFSIFSFTPVSSQTLNINDFFDSNTGLPIGIDEQITVEQIPEIPKPNELVSFRITSYMSDLNKAKITWTQDGVVLLSQVGAVTNQIQAPESGKSSTIIITITKETGGIVTKKIVLNPADVDLIYEADTYTHPFFKGKRLFTSESVIRFIANPNFVLSGKQIPASNLVYTWKINGTVDQVSSGYGRNIFTTKGMLIERPLEVEVQVSAINSTLVASQSIKVRSQAGEVVLYENNPLLGIVYEKAISGNFLLERSQVDFEAVPYFFGVLQRDSDNLKYTWLINNVRVASKSPQENYLLLQNANNEDGRAIITARVEHLQNILQNGQVQLELNFKKIKEQINNETFNF